MDTKIDDRLNEISEGIAVAYANNSQLSRLAKLDEKPTSPGTGWAPIEVIIPIDPTDIEDPSAAWKVAYAPIAMHMVIAEERHLLASLCLAGEYGTMRRDDPELEILHNAIIDLAGGFHQPNAMVMPRDLSEQFRAKYPAGEQNLADFGFADEDLNIAWMPTPDDHFAVYEASAVLWEAVTFGNTGRLLIQIKPNIGGITGAIKITSYARVGTDEDRIRVIRLDAQKGAETKD